MGGRQKDGRTPGAQTVTLRLSLDAASVTKSLIMILPVRTLSQHRKSKQQVIDGSECSRHCKIRRSWRHHSGRRGRWRSAVLPARPRGSTGATAVVPARLGGVLEQ